MKRVNLDFTICLKDTLANCMCDKCWDESVGEYQRKVWGKSQ